MARADLLVRLVKSASQGDQTLFRRTVEALVAEERAKQHHVVARRLEEVLRASAERQNGARSVAPLFSTSSSDQVLEVMPERDLESLVLPRLVHGVVRELVEEQQRIELLRDYGLEPRHRILLVGPPGNGKTSLAESIATELMLPLFLVRYEAVVASYLGETSMRLQKLFDFVRTRRCVLFFDEFDTLGKERGDLHETGEIKRVVSTLLLQIDRLPSHVVVVTATNHPELLDRAVWRRFQIRLHLPSPTLQSIACWLESFLSLHQLTWDLSAKEVAAELEGASFGEIEELAIDVLRRRVLEQPGADEARILRERLHQWRGRFVPGPEDEEATVG